MALYTLYRSVLHTIPVPRCTPFFSFFFFNDTATTEIYTLSLHDALPISPATCCRSPHPSSSCRRPSAWRDRKSTRLNSSHTVISYAVFCLKKKKKQNPSNSCRTKLLTVKQLAYSLTF